MFFYNKQRITDTIPIVASANATDNIIIMAQAFYGNRTGTEVKRDAIDRFILGHMDCTINWDERIDRTIVRIPRAEHLVLIYNKYEEAKRLEFKKQYFEEDGYVLKPLAVIPELNLELYSRCIVCRMNDAGQLESLEDEDYSQFMDYLSE